MTSHELHKVSVDFFTELGRLQRLERISQKSNRYVLGCMLGNPPAPLPGLVDDTPAKLLTDRAYIRTIDNKNTEAPMRT